MVSVLDPFRSEPIESIIAERDVLRKRVAYLDSLFRPRSNLSWKDKLLGHLGPISSVHRAAHDTTNGAITVLSAVAGIWTYSKLNGSPINLLGSLLCYVVLALGLGFVQYRSAEKKLMKENQTFDTEQIKKLARDR